MSGTLERVGELERRYVGEVLDTRFRTSQGSLMTSRLEARFAERFGCRFAIAHVNGTVTMHAVLEAWRIGPGDEVIVPPLTMSSTAMAVLEANATPVFADVDAGTFELDPVSVASRVSDRTRAIITVALYGLAPDMDPILDLARSRGIRVLEDNAQAFLSTYKGHLVGTLGDAASFSFQSSKHMTSGEGGMVTTDDPELANEVRRVQSLGYAGVSAGQGKITKKDIQDPAYARHVSLGWNYRMPELCSAVALAQLERLEALVAVRTHAARCYAEALEGTGCSWLRPQAVPADRTHSYWTWVASLEHPDLSWHEFRDRFAELGGEGIYAAWRLSHLEPMFGAAAFRGREKLIAPERLAEYGPGLCPVAERIQPRLLQFKTDLWEAGSAEREAEVLARTIRSFG